MGAASSIQETMGIDEFKKLREEYENKLKEDGVTDEMIYNHMQSIMNQISATSQKVSLSMELVNGSHSCNNCTDEVRRKKDLKLLSKPDHTLVVMKTKVAAAVKVVLENVSEIEAPDPIVSAQQNFDSLLIPGGHYCRRPTDVYYATDNAMLRTHLTAHLVDVVGSGVASYFMSGPVFRRLEEDDEHSELCHQLQVVHIYEAEAAGEETGEGARYVAVAEGIAKAVLPVEAKLRWEELEEFPFAQDSLMSLETLFLDQPLEVAHGAQLSQEMLLALGHPAKAGFVISFDLDHLVMVGSNVTSGIRTVQV